MNCDTPNLPTVPGSTLTAEQRALAERMTIDSLNATEAGATLAIPGRTARGWALTPAFQDYTAYLTEQAVSEAARRVRNRFARVADSVAETVSRLALGKGRNATPKHPYQRDFCKMVLDRVTPAQAPASEVGLRVPTDHGDIVLVFRSKAPG